MEFTVITNLAAEIEFSPDSTVSKTVHQDDSLKAVLFGFAAGQELSEHTASMPAILYFLDGSARVTLGDEPFEARAGAFIHMPPHLPHSITATEPTRMLLLLLKNAKDKSATAKASS